MRNSPFLVLGSAFFLLWLAAGKSLPVICNDSSRLAAIESLAMRGTFEISDSMFVGTCDKVRIPPRGDGGRYYSDKSPLLSVLGAVLYKGLTFLGFDMRRDLAPVYRLLTFFLVVLPAFAILYLLALRLTGREEKHWWALVGAFFGTLALTYSVVLNSFVPAAACLLGAYVFFERGRLAIAGLLLGLAVSFEYATALFAVALGALCIYEYGRKSILFAATALAPVLATFAINWHLSGHWMPLNLIVDRYLYAGGIQRPQYLLGGKSFRDHSLGSMLLYLWHGSVGYKGVLSHSAILLVGFLGLRLAERPRAIAVVGAVAATFLYFCLDATYYFGGSCYGYRYMIPWMPLVALFAVDYIQAHGAKPWMKAVVVVSVVTSIAGLRSPWLIHKWAGLDLDTFDFFLVHNPEANPYVAAERRLAMVTREMAPVPPSDLSSKAFLYYRAMQPEKALGLLQLMGNDPQRHCFAAIVFSEQGLALPDLRERSRRLCPTPPAATAAPVKKP